MKPIRLFIAAMLWLTRFELAIAETCSTNLSYIRRLRSDEIHWMTEQTRFRSSIQPLSTTRSSNA